MSDSLRPQASLTITNSREFTQTHVPQVGDAIQPSHPLSSPSPAGSQIVKDEPRVGPNTVGNFVPDPGSSKYLVIIQL